MSRNKKSDPSKPMGQMMEGEESGEPPSCIVWGLSHISSLYN